MAFFGGRWRGDQGLSHWRNIVANLKRHSDLTPVSTSHYHPSLARVEMKVRVYYYIIL